jgi:hypothetical protein
MSTTRVLRPSRARNAARFTAVVVFPHPPFWLTTAIARIMDSFLYLGATRLVGADWVLVASKPVGIPLAEGGAAGGSYAAQRRSRSAEWSRQQPQSNFYGTFSERGCTEGNRSAARCQQLVGFESIQTTGCWELPSRARSARRAVRPSGEWERCGFRAASSRHVVEGAGIAAADLSVITAGSTSEVDGNIRDPH